MADVKWIKITTDMFDNRKIKHLRRLPEGNNIVLIWIMLLTMAGRCNSGGMIFLTENIPYTPKMLADELDFEENTVKLALEALERLGMIVSDSEYFAIAGWNEHQNTEGLEKIRAQTRKRVAKYREQQKLLSSNATRNVTVTQCNATDIDKDIDIDKELDIDKDIDNNIDQNEKKKETYAEAFDKLWESYPRKIGKKRAFEAYKRAIKSGATDEAIADGIERYRQYVESRKFEEKYIKQGSTWFAGECWNDEYDISARQLTPDEERDYQELWGD